MPTPTVLDTNVVVGLLDAQDVWNQRALELRVALKAHDCEPVIFDCVLAEAVSILARRTYEKRRAAQLEHLLDQLQGQFPSRSIVWWGPDWPKLYDEIVALVKQSNGELNSNDALIALSCRWRGLQFIASFDGDFDNLPWLKRISQPADLP
jgi:predicted nucleic acid-binding protein